MKEETRGVMDKNVANDEVLKLQEFIDKLPAELSELEKRELANVKRLLEIGALGSDMVHELRNPLTVIQMAVSALEVYVKEKNSPIEKCFDDIEVKLDHANRLICDYSKYIKLGMPVFEEADLNMLVEASVGKAYENISNDIKIAKELGDIPLWKVDSAQIAGAIDSIMTNAFEAMDGSGELTLSTSFFRDADEMIICFIDNGCGISEEHLDKLRKPFFTTKRERSGLGLSMAAYIIESNHGGTIEVESEPGKGTNVTMKLPSRK